jgi:DNA-binding beta-propeller fold protein YncE
MKRRDERRRAVGLLGVSLVALLACDDASRDSEKSSADIAPPSRPSGDQPRDPVGAEDNNADGSPVAPPETEREASFQAPVVTGRYVWTANPASGRVAVIDAESFEIRSAQAGNRPTFVAGLEFPSGARSALVINTGADDASVLSLTDTGIAALHVPLHQGADSWSVSPDRRFAIAWTDRQKAGDVDPTDGFQDITVLDLGGDAVSATRLTVGYRPSAFFFDARGQRAFGVTEDGISVIDLTSGAVRLSRLVSLPSKARTQPDVSITADGSRALARLEGSAVLYDIDLDSGQTRELTLDGVITDLDLSADGSRAVAVIRSLAGNPADAGVAADAGDADAGSDPAPSASSASEAVFIDVPAGLADPAGRRTLTLPSGGMGSVALSRDGSHAVLFSNALGSGEVTLVGPDLAFRSVNLIAPVRAVFVTADSSHAIALQDPPRGSIKKGAFSILSLDSVRAPKLVAADAPAEFVALDTENSERAIVTVSDPATGVFGAYFVRMPSLQVDFSSLSSRPLSSGTVPAAQKAFVAQEHPEGRITFIDLGEGQSREITGFELSAKVVNE